MGHAKYTVEILTEAVAASTSYLGVVRYLGLRPAGGTQQNIRRRIIQHKIDTSHFKGRASSRGVPSVKRKTPAEILVHVPGSSRANLTQLRRAMIESGIEQVCKICSQDDVWFGLPLTLQIDHEDGDWTNNLLDNLRFICPNCHTQQPTSRSYRLR